MGRFQGVGLALSSPNEGAVEFEEWERERLERAVAVVATISPDGGPHAAPVMIHFEGDDIQFETEPDARKYKNLVSNPQVAICAYGSPKWGVVVRGTARVLTPGGNGAQAQILVHPHEKVSWRRKEG